MPVKCNGAEFKAWLNSNWSDDPEDDPYWDDVCVSIDGVETDDPVIEDIFDGSKVVIIEGTIFMKQVVPSDGTCAMKHFRMWKKNLDTMTIVVHFDKQVHEEVKAALAQIKGVKIV